MSDCLHCGEPVEEGEQSPNFQSQAIHLECGFRMVAGSIAHVQRRCMAPDVWHQRKKAARDRRLLHLRLCDNPNDAVAYCYLALMARREGRRIAAMTFAKRALSCGPRTLHTDRVAQMRELVR